MKLALLIIAIVLVIIGLIAGGALIGGELGKTLIWLGVLAIVVCAILGAMVYRGLQT